MAKKRSGNSPAVSRFVRHESARVVGIRRPRRYYLIVCEGEKTEPLYFKGLKKALARKSEREKQTGLPIDRLWVVFDRDSFPAKHFNQAIELCQRESIGCAWSNEAFELWYLLHFQYFDSSIIRQQYLEMLTTRLREMVSQNFQYRKNDPAFYLVLKNHGNQEQAIRNAERLCKIYEGRKDFASHSPCTMVHLLVKELQTLI